MIVLSQIDILAIAKRCVPISFIIIFKPVKKSRPTGYTLYVDLTVKLDIHVFIPDYRRLWKLKSLWLFYGISWN